MADGAAGTTPVYGHGLRLLWYQARVAPFIVDTRPLYPHSSRAPPGFTCFSSFAEGVWAHGQHREVIEGGGVPFQPVSLAGCLPRGAWEPVPLGQFEVTPFKLISPLTPTLLRGTLNWAAFWPLRT